MSVKFKNIIHYSLLYLAISFGGMALPTIIGREIFVLLILLLGLSSFYYRDFINSKYFLFILILSLALFSVFCVSTLSIGSIFSIIGTYLFTYAVIKFDTKNLIIRLIRIIAVISIISVLIFTVTKIFGFDFFSPIFPYLYKGGNEFDDKGVYSYGGFIYRWVFIHNERNCGPFGEPGQYQCILSVALYFSLYKKEIFKSIKEQIIYITIFTITLISTLSTNGYIALSIIYAGFLFQSNGNRKIKKITVYLLCIILILFITTDLGRDFYNIAIYDKFFSNEDKFTIYSNTTAARTNGIVEIYNYLENNPRILFGIGYDNLEKLNFDTVSGLPLLLLAVGIIPFSIIVFSILYFARYSCRNINEYIIRIMLFISMGLGQPHIMNPCLFFMIYYDYIKLKLNR